MEKHRRQAKFALVMIKSWRVDKVGDSTSFMLSAGEL